MVWVSDPKMAYRAEGNVDDGLLFKVFKNALPGFICVIDVAEAVRSSV
jgi:hypothetical protein